MSWFAPLYDPVLSFAERGFLGRWRREAVGDLAGRVVEIGAGTGANLAHYPAEVVELVLTEPDPGMRRMLEDKIADARREDHGRAVRVSASPAEALDVDDASCDAVVATLVLCTVSDPERALSEIARVLRPGGTFRFVEHVGAHTPGWARVQRWVEPGWRRVAGDCHLTRDTVGAITRAGFALDAIAEASPRGMPPFLSPFVRGRARRSA